MIRAATDLATGHPVRLRIGKAGDRAEQQAWTEDCARKLGDCGARLIDFGFIGRDRRFEATGRRSDGDRAPVTTQAIEWLEASKPASARVLHLEDLPDARELRLRGFVPVKLSLLNRDRFARVLWPLLAGRSVALLDDPGCRAGAGPGAACESGRNDAALCLAFLRLARVNPHDVCAIVRIPSAAVGRAEARHYICRKRPRQLVEHAAEGHAVYGGGQGPPDQENIRNRPQRFALRASARIADPRAVRMLDEGNNLLQKGRHAAAERTLRAALAAFDRRGDLIHGADAAMRLGRALLDRGRATDACSIFKVAHEKCLKIELAVPAVVACVYAGVAETDLVLLDRADSSLRAAYSAASALRDRQLISSCGIALARNLLWQGRHADAMAMLESVGPEGEPEGCARYWCLVGRLRLTVNDLGEAWRAVLRARDAVGNVADPAVEAIVRSSEAMVQARLGDVEALAVHVRAGFLAARRAHQPLRALRLRLTLIEGLMNAGRIGRARVLSRHLDAMAKLTIPPLLKNRLDHVLERLSRDEVVKRSLESTPSAREAVARFRLAPSAGSIGDIDGLTQLLSLCHELDDEREALARVATVIRKQTHALGVGIFGLAGVQMGGAGSVNASIARRSIDLGQPIRPEQTSGGVEAATPIRYLGRVIGSLATRWSIEGPDNAERAMAFGAAAAAVCAPLVHVILDKRTCVPSEGVAWDLIGVSPAIEEVRRAIARAANAPFTVLIEGESGSGKELVARAIHGAGCRRERRFSALNCAAMPEDLVDAELFGHAKGAFTGAVSERLGLFESADGGTVFLDEVGELSARAQAKLLRVIQEGEIRRIGENFTRPIDARLVAATNRSLKAESEAGRFRQDLLYRLDVIRILVPPLRDRVEDIPLLAARFWRHAADRIGSKAVLGPGALSVLARYHWPGNVRELQNVLMGLVVAVPSRGVVGASDMPAAIAGAARPMSHESLESARLEFEQRFVRAALARAAGHRGQTATALGLSRQGLAKLMQRLHLDDA
jgi:transcriptional regulator with AAA-type ATPase domain